MNQSVIGHRSICSISFLQVGRGWALVASAQGGSQALSHAPEAWEFLCEYFLEDIDDAKSFPVAPPAHDARQLSSKRAEG